MKIFSKSFCLVLLSAFMIFGCTSQFAEINQNPNNLTKAPAENVLANAIVRLVSITQSNAGFGISARWSQQVANFVFPDSDIYRPRDSDVATIWSEIYSRVLINTHVLITDAKADNRPNMQAIATVLRVYAFQTATDLWGDVPYSEALKGFDNATQKTGILNPTYDSQQSI